MCMCEQTVFVCEAFVELLEEACQRRPALDVRYSVMSCVTRNVSALQIFQVLVGLLRDAAGV